MSGISLLLITMVTNASVRVFLASLGLVGMAISFPTIYLYSGEVFPTVVRNVGVGLGSISARIGSMVAPYIATMVIYYLFISLMFRYTKHNLQLVECFIYEY